MASARSASMSCSQIAHASASNGSGRRMTRRCGRARTERPDERIGAEAVVERAQVVVDAEREAHALQGLLGHVGAVGPGHEHHAIARGLADADDRGHALDVHEPLEAAVAPAAHDAVAPRPRQAIGPYRAHLSPDLDHRGADSTPRARRAAERSPAAMDGR